MKKLIQNQSGVAMVEGVIIIPFFIIIAMGLVFLHHMYSGKLEAVSIAKNTALKISENKNGNCGGSEVDMTKEASESDISIDDEKANEAYKFANDGKSNFMWPHVSPVAGVTVNGIPRPLGGPSVKIKGGQKYLCNSQPADGLIEAISNKAKSWWNI